MKKISVTDIQTGEIDTKNGTLSKDKALLKWLIDFVEEGLKKGLFEVGDIMPSKKELADFHHVSTGTVQNAIRYAEDLGYFKSRQCIGTMIAFGGEKNVKPKSKKDLACDEIKKYIIQNKIKKGELLPPSREIAQKINLSKNTVRLALDVLIREGIISDNTTIPNKPLKTLNVNYDEIEAEKGGHARTETLSKNLYVKIKDYIVKNYKTGDKIITNEEFAKMFNVSVRTVNSATRRLNKEKVILSLRGQYGTKYINNPDKLLKQGGEKSKFMSNAKGKSEIKKSYSYNWQRVLNLIKKYMIAHHEAGDKLPSMKNLAQTFEVSSNTVRKAVKELVAQGVLFCQRGKYGGVFIVELPAKEDSYQWLALNPKFLEN